MEKETKKRPNIINQNVGNVWVGILLFLTFLITVGLVLASDTIVTLASAKRQEQIVVATNIAEGGIDYAIWKLNKTGGSYTGSDPSVPVNFPQTGTAIGQVDIAIIDGANPQTKSILVKSYVPSKTAPKAQRQLKATVSATPDEAGIAFRYGIQVGLGGVDFQPNTIINGNVYSNANITGQGRINGDGFAVGTIDRRMNITGQTRTGQPVVQLPALDQTYWKNKASEGDIINGDYIQEGGSIGPKQINGSVQLTNVTIDGPLYITGNLTMGGTIAINNNFGSRGTVVLVDGSIDDNGGTITSTNSTPKGYLLFASNSNITLSTGSFGGIFYAITGTLNINPHSHLVSLTAYQLNMLPNSDLTYDSGLVSAEFSAGPGGSYAMKEYQVCKLTPNVNECNL